MTGEIIDSKMILFLILKLQLYFIIFNNNNYYCERLFGNNQILIVQPQTYEFNYKYNDGHMA